MGRPLRTATFTEPRNVSDVVKMEHDGHYCRDAVTLKSGFGVLDIGAVLGKQSIGSASSAAKSGGNTANTGTFTLDATTPVLAGAKTGVYKLRCISAVTNGGVFRLEDPDGIVLGDFTIPPGAGNQVTIAEQIKGVLTDSTQDWAVGEGFDITVAAGSGKFGPYDPTATDGRQTAVGLLLHKHDTTSDVPQAIILARGPAEVVVTELKWHDNVTTQAQKDAAIASLKGIGIVTRMAA